MIVLLCFELQYFTFLSYRYIFFVTLLSIPESSFSVAFKMFDINNDGYVPCVTSVLCSRSKLRNLSYKHLLFPSYSIYFHYYHHNKIFNGHHDIIIIIVYGDAVNLHVLSTEFKDTSLCGNFAVFHSYAYNVTFAFFHVFCFFLRGLIV